MEAKPIMTPTTLKSSRNIPKVENGVLDLWKAYPESDGRGVKIAVMGTWTMQQSV